VSDVKLGTEYMIGNFAANQFPQSLVALKDMFGPRGKGLPTAAPDLCLQLPPDQPA
jgi:hypothetical protein